MKTVFHFLDKKNPSNSMMRVSKAKKIMGPNFIGPEAMRSIQSRIPLYIPETIPEIPYEEAWLKEHAEDTLLMFGPQKFQDGTPLTINTLREHFGYNTDTSEPCMYNQDWYTKEVFASETTLENKWYMLEKHVDNTTRAQQPQAIEEAFESHQQFPLAVLTAFAFFANYLLTDGEKLWQNDFIWCSDRDNNGDQIYTGRYTDPEQKNKNGFNIHRHLNIRPCYGAIKQIV